jgi:hypothetical protein
MEAKARGAYIIGVSNSQSTIFDDSIKVSSCEEILYPLVTAIPLQIFAYYSTIARGLDPDKPRSGKICYYEVTNISKPVFLRMIVSQYTGEPLVADQFRGLCAY